MITDVHSHILSDNPSEKIISFCMKDRDSEIFHNAENISVGIHPWFLGGTDMEEQIEWVKYIVENDKRVVAIGECGTDNICSTPKELQTSAFLSMIKISEMSNMPLIIHSVKTAGEIVSLKKHLKPRQKWIMHGFRGKKDTAHQLISQGIYLSLGEKFNPITPKVIPKDMLLMETDESSLSINMIARKIAASIDLDAEEVIKIVSENAYNLFFNR